MQVLKNRNDDRVAPCGHEKRLESDSRCHAFQTYAESTCNFIFNYIFLSSDHIHLKYLHIRVVNVKRLYVGKYLYIHKEDYVLCRIKI